MRTINADDLIERLEEDLDLIDEMEHWRLKEVEPVYRQIIDIINTLAKEANRSELACFEDCNTCEERCRAWQNGWDARCDRYKWHDLRKNPEDLPKEHDSIFVKYKGTDIWNDSMWEKQSDDVLVCFELEDETRTIQKMPSRDGRFKSSSSLITLKATPIAWREIEPFEEVEG